MSIVTAPDPSAVQSFNQNKFVITNAIGNINTDGLGGFNKINSFDGVLATLVGAAVPTQRINTPVNEVTNDIAERETSNVTTERDSIGLKRKELNNSPSEAKEEM